MKRKRERSPSPSDSDSSYSSRGSYSSYSSDYSSSSSDSECDDIPWHLQDSFRRSKSRIRRIMWEKPRRNVIKYNNDRPDDSDGEGEKNKIYVGGLPPSVEESDIRMVFSSFGKIRNVDLKQGFCFIKFASKDSSDLVIASNLQLKMRGQFIKIARARKDTTDIRDGNNNSGGDGSGSDDEHVSRRRSKVSGSDPNITLRQRWGGQPGCRLYVGNLSPSVTEVDLISLFCVYGEVRFCFLCTKDKYARYGFVELNSKKCAEDAIKGLSGYKYKGRELKVDITRDAEKPVPTNVHVVFGFECEKRIAEIRGLDNTIYLRGDGNYRERCYNEDFMDELKRLCSTYGVVKDVSLVDNGLDSPEIRVVFKSFKNCK